MLFNQHISLFMALMGFLCVWLFPILIYHNLKKLQNLNYNIIGLGISVYIKHLTLNDFEWMGLDPLPFYYILIFGNIINVIYRYLLLRKYWLTQEEFIDWTALELGYLLYFIATNHININILRIFMIVSEYYFYRIHYRHAYKDKHFYDEDV